MKPANHQTTVLVCFLAPLSAPTVLCARDYYVAQKAPNAADTNPGTETRPFKTLTKACEAAQAGDTVTIKEGVYREALLPKHSGTEGKPIVFQAYKTDFVMIKGSEVLTGLEKEGANFWVKRPWTRRLYWVEWMRDLSETPYRDSARMEQVFVNEEPLQWVPSRADLKPGCFHWKGDPKDGELVICPPEGVLDLNQALVEIPVRENILGAWNGDPRGIADVRHLRQYQPDRDVSKATWPEIHYIHVKGLLFRLLREPTDRRWLLLRVRDLLGWSLPSQSLLCQRRSRQHVLRSGPRTVSLLEHPRRRQCHHWPSSRRTTCKSCLT